MQQYDIQFKLQMEIHSKYMKLLSENLNEGEESWFAAIDEVVFNCIKCVLLSEKLRMIANQIICVLVPKDHLIEAPKDNIILESQCHQNVHVGEHLYRKEPWKISRNTSSGIIYQRNHTVIRNAEKLHQSKKFAKRKARTQMFQDINKDGCLVNIKGNAGTNETEQKNRPTKKNVMQKEKI